MSDSNLSVFLSYSHSDVAWMRWVRHELTSLGLAVVVDEADVHVGQSLPDVLNRQLSSVGLFVALFSHDYFAEGRWSGDEMAAAYQLWRTQKLAICPLNLDEVDAPPLYQRLVRARLDDKSEPNARMLLRREIEKVAGAPRSEPTSIGAAPPYPGSATRRSGSIVIPVASDLLDIAIEQGLEVVRRESLAPPSAELDVQMARLQTVSRSYNAMAPADVQALVVPLQGALTDLLQRTTSPERKRDELLALAKATGLLAYATLDRGSPEKAHQLAIVCRELASLVGHQGLQAWALGTEAMVLRFQEDVMGSLKAVDRGLALPVEGSLRARLHAQRALGLGKLGAGTAIAEELANCAADMDSASEPAQDLAEGIFVFPAAKFYYYTGMGLLDAGPEQAQAAVDSSAEAIELFAAGPAEIRSPPDELLAHAHLAYGLLKIGEIDQIPEVIEPLLRSDPAHRTSWQRRWLSRLDYALEQDAVNPSSSAGQIRSLVAEFLDVDTRSNPSEPPIADLS